MSSDSDYFLYSNAHYLDMCMCVFQCNDEIPAGRLKYQEKYPNRPLPPETVFETILHRLRTTGSFHPPPSEPTRLRSGRIRAPVEAQEDDNDVTVTTSTERSSSRDLHLNEPIPLFAPSRAPRRSRKRAKKIQKPYFLKGSRQLTPSDYAPRLEFCQWYVDQVKENPEFAQRVLWSDLATITRYTIENEDYWSYIKLKGKVPSWHINVWAGIIGTKLIGPVFLPKDETKNYLAIILSKIQDSLEELPVAELKDIVFHHSNIPSRFTFNWKNCLDECFPVWIGDGGPVAWPKCATSLNPAQFLLWGDVKDYMFKKTCKTEEEMRQTIISTFDNIRNKPNLVAKAIKLAHRKATECIDFKGGDISWLL